MCLAIVKTYAPRPKSKTFFFSADILLTENFVQFPIVFWSLAFVNPKLHMPDSNVYTTAKVPKVGKVRFKRPPNDPHSFSRHSSSESFG